MKIPKYINEVIVTSIPINKNLKRFLISVYRGLYEHNGPRFAADWMKSISETCLAYRADPDRLKKVDQYLRRIPLRSKGWKRAILRCMDCQPMPMLDLLKLYCGFQKPLVTVEESAQTEQQSLAHIGETVRSDIPKWLRYWLDFVCARDLLEFYKTKTSRTSWWRKLSAKVEDPILGIEDYHQKWHNLLCRRWRPQTEGHCIEMASSERTPWPESYKDYGQEVSNRSRSLEKDHQALDDWILMMGISDMRHRVPFSPESCRLILDLLGETEKSYLQKQPSYLSSSRIVDDYSFMAGDIHHIPKKGTIKRRPIAVPNRYVQLGLAPVQEELRRIVSVLPRDCTFDQSRFDTQITGRVSNPNLYVGSVDLSSATDNLPFAWGKLIIDRLFGTRRSKICNTVRRSWDLFCETTRAEWYNSGYPTRWTVGQPLGSLPSFYTLAITHNCVLEALAFSCGLLHSPYCILGDDLLVNNKKLRKLYISEFEKRGIPLSLQKSYEGNLTEFAGKIYIKGQLPAYRSDHQPLTWESLFDYQRATGIRIPWRHLPRSLQKMVERTITDLLSDSPKKFPALKPKVKGIYPMAMALAPASYNLAVTGLVGERSGLGKNLNQVLIDRLALFYLNLEKEEVIPPSPELASDIFRLGNAVMTWSGRRSCVKHGYHLRVKKVQLPEWFKAKVRPNTTSSVVRSAFCALVAQELPHNEL